MRLLELKADFPYELVNTWVNIREPDDRVGTMGGLAPVLTQVLDVDVDLWGSHDAASYLAHPATACAVETILFDIGHPLSDTE
jgi:hypothetical protein